MPHNPDRLDVVRRADALAERVHRLAERHRRRLSQSSPGLRNQLRRATTSITLDLREACGHHPPWKAAALLDVSIGSCTEAERLLRLCQRLHALDESVEAVIGDVRQVRMMTYGFRKRVLRGPASEDRPHTRISSLRTV
jgi:four helix bundle protein